MGIAKISLKDLGEISFVIGTLKSSKYFNRIIDKLEIKLHDTVEIISHCETAHHDDNQTIARAQQMF